MKYFDALETRDPEQRERDLFAALPGQIAHAVQNAPAFAELYQGVVPAQVNSRAALALLQRVEAVTGFPLDKSALETAAATFDQEVSEAIAADPQLAAYVRELKRRAFSQ